MGVAQVGTLQHHGGLAAGGDVGHGDARRRVLARQADAHVGLLHLLRAVAKGRARLVVVRHLLRLVGVVGLSAEDAEEVAVLLRIRVVDGQRQVGVAVAVLNVVFPLGEVLVDGAVAPDKAAAVLGLNRCFTSYLSNVFTMESDAGVRYESHLPVDDCFVVFRSAFSFRVAVGRAAVDGDVFLFLPGVHQAHLILFVVVDGLLPQRDLRVAPGHAVALESPRDARRLPALGRYPDVVLALFVVVRVQPLPCQIDRFAAVVDVASGCCLRSHLGEELAAHVLPLGNHDRLQLILGELERRGDGIAEGDGFHHLHLILLLFLVVGDEEAAAAADEVVEGFAYIDIARRAHVGLAVAGGEVLRGGLYIQAVFVPRLFPRSFDASIH